MKIFSFGCKIAEFVYFNDVIDEQQLYNVDNIKTISRFFVCIKFYEDLILMRYYFNIG